MARGQMDDAELKAVLQTELANALGRDGGTLSYERRKLLGYYNGDPEWFPADQGRSSVISRLATETIEWAKPQILRLFQGDKVFNFEPNRPGDEKQAQIATQYTNHILYNDNPGFRILMTWLDDGIKQKNGYIKVFWNEERTSDISIYTGLSDLEYEQVIQGGEDGDIEILEHHEYPNSAVMAMLPAIPPIMPMLHDCKLRVWRKESRVRIINLPPEEVMVSRHAPDTVLDGNHFVAHRSQKTVSQLREMDFDEEKIQDALGAQSEQDFNTERVARFLPEEDFPGMDSRLDEAMMSVWISEAYIKVDWDNDGIAELRRIVFAGDQPIVIFENELCEDVAILAWTPIPQSHKHIGFSLIDLVADLVDIKTSLTRQILDSLNYTTSPRIMVDEMSIGVNTIDDLMDHRPGSIIRLNGIQGIQPLTVPFVGQAAVPMLQYLDEAAEIRSGITRTGQGIDPQVLNRTATESMALSNAATSRMELIARIFGEQGLKILAKRILGLVIRHQQEARIVRLTGEWTPIDVRNWRENMDITVSVGLGAGNKEQMVHNLSTILQMQQTILMAQKGFGGLVSPENVYDTLDRLTEAMGFREQFFTNPKQQQQPQQQPDPEMLKAHNQMQIEQARLQAEIAQQKIKTQFEMAQSQQEFEHKIQLEDRDAEHQIQLEQQREDFKAKLEMARFAAQAHQAEMKNMAPVI